MTNNIDNRQLLVDAQDGIFVFPALSVAMVYAHHLPIVVNFHHLLIASLLVSGQGIGLNFLGHCLFFAREYANVFQPFGQHPHVLVHSASQPHQHLRYLHDSHSFLSFVLHEHVFLCVGPQGHQHEQGNSRYLFHCLFVLVDTCYECALNNSDETTRHSVT